MKSKKTIVMIDRFSNVNTGEEVFKMYMSKPDIHFPLFVDSLSAAFEKASEIFGSDKYIIME